jgi:hypothetical protein
MGGLDFGTWIWGEATEACASERASEVGMRPNVGCAHAGVGVCLASAWTRGSDVRH